MYRHMPPEADAVPCISGQKEAPEVVEATGVIVTGVDYYVCA